MYRLLLPALLLLAFPGISQIKYLHCGKILDCKGSQPLLEQTIIVNKNEITSIRSGYIKAPDTVELIDLKAYTLMPGFMDMHVHIEGSLSPRRYEDGFRLNEADVALRATVNCEKTLLAGFTTVRDLGGSGINVSLRNAINEGYIKGPRIYTCEKGIATTGGHADPTNGVRKDLQADPGPKEGVINGAEDARKAVRQRYKNGADVIKITSTGGVLSVAKDGMGAQFTEEEIAAIVETANDYGFVTAAHAHGAEGMLRAVRGGISSIEHGTFMTEEIMALMIEKGTYFVPTISAGKFVYEKAKTEPFFFPPMVRAKAIEIGPLIQETFRKAFVRGVKIAFGTDTGVSAHGDNAKEFEYMVEAGMSPYQAIKSATIEASKLLRITDKYGTIEAGKMADLVGVKGDPLTDIRLLQKINFVMKDGKMYKKD